MNIKTKADTQYANPGYQSMVPRYIAWYTGPKSSTIACTEATHANTYWIQKIWSLKWSHKNHISLKDYHGFFYWYIKNIITFPISWGPIIFVRPDLIVVVVISLNNFITADRYKSSGIFANKMQTNEASVLVRQIVVIVRSCNLTT